jgi:hypothetical protein
MCSKLIRTARRGRRQALGGEEGFVLSLLAVSLLVLLTLVALVLDGSFLFAFKMQQQDNAEHAAFAAIRNLGALPPAVPPETRAADIAARNQYFSRTEGELDNYSVSTGCWSSGSFVPVGGPDCPTANAVKVALSTGNEKGYKTFFKSLLGLEKVASASSGVAYNDQGTFRLVH